MGGAHGGGVRQHRHLVVKAVHRDLKGGVALGVCGVVAHVVHLHVVVVGAAPNDGGSGLAVLHRQLRRRLHRGPAGTAFQCDLHGIAAVGQIQALHGGQCVVRAGVCRQGIRPEHQGAVIPLFLLLAEGGTVHALIQGLHRHGKGVGAVCRLLKGDVGALICRSGLLTGAHVDVQVTCAAHGHHGGHLAVLHRQLTGGDVEHGGAGVHGDGIHAVLQVTAVDRFHAVVGDLHRRCHLRRTRHLAGVLCRCACGGAAGGGGVAAAGQQGQGQQAGQ